MNKAGLVGGSYKVLIHTNMPNALHTLLKVSVRKIHYLVHTSWSVRNYPGWRYQKCETPITCLACSAAALVLVPCLFPPKDPTTLSSCDELAFSQPPQH